MNDHCTYIQPKPNEVREFVDWKAAQEPEALADLDDAVLYTFWFVYIGRGLPRLTIRIDEGWLEWSPDPLHYTAIIESLSLLLDDGPAIAARLFPEGGVDDGVHEC